MKNPALRNFLSFLLVLVVTVTVIACLSMVSAAKSDPVAELRQEQSKQTEVMKISAAVPEDNSSILISVGAFLLLLAIPVTGVTLFVKARRKGKVAEVVSQGGRRYVPRSDMTFSRKSRVRV